MVEQISLSESSAPLTEEVPDMDSLIINGVNTPDENDAK